MAWSDWAGAIGSAIGGLFGAGGSVASNALSYNENKKLMEKQYDLSIKGYKESPQAVRQGLEKAGFNPLLSYASGGNFASSGLGSSSTPDIGSSITNGYKTFTLERKLNNANIGNINADTVLKGEQAATEQARRVQMSFQNSVYELESELKRKDLSSYDRRIKTALYEQMQRAENFRAMANLQGYNAETARIGANAQQLNAEYGNPIRAIKTEGSKHWKSFKKSHPFIYAIGKKVGPSNALDVTFK